jgi:hypothetical protein
MGPTQPPVRWVPGFFPGVKRPARGDDHPPPSSAEVKETIVQILLLPVCAFMACSRLSFIFYLLPWYWPGRIRENNKSLSKCNLLWGRRLNTGLSECETVVLSAACDIGGFVTRMSGRCLENSTRNLFALFSWLYMFTEFELYSPLSFPKSKTSSYDQKS